MNMQLLHIYRNTPIGRETLLQSLYFCKCLNATMVVYLPAHKKFLMYFDGDVVQIDLDDSYLSAPGSAAANAAALIEGSGVAARFLEPKAFTASTLPDITSDFDFMCCPRSISDLSSKIGLGYIGPRVRRIVNSAKFPVLLPSTVYKPWRSLAVFFGGSANAVNALKLGLRVSRLAAMPLRVYSYIENSDKTRLEQVIAENDLGGDMDTCIDDWQFWNRGTFEDNLMALPHDALLVTGAFGHGVIRDIVFGSKMEKLQATMPNNMLIVGPRYLPGIASSHQ